jgi:glutamine cyclotransferase
MKKYLAVYLCLFVIACNNTNNTDTNSDSKDTAENTAIAPPIALNYTIQKVYNHDTSAYTQGLEWHNNKLIEGTGLRGKSVLYQMDDQLSPFGKQVNLEPSYFGEGITVFDGKIYQLTWEEHIVFVYDAKTFKKINTLNWPYEGWGLTHNDTSLIVSTGSSNLYFVNPKDFSIQKTLGVYNEYGYQSMLNELEYVDGKVFANIYGQNDIVVIDANTGRITNKIDCSNLLTQAKVTYNPLTIDPGFVLNGIAYKKTTNTYFLTGKCWPVIVEVKLN